MIPSGSPTGYGAAMSDPKLTGKQVRFLRARAHGLKPVVLVGADRVTPAVLKHIDEALEQHELMKVRVTDAEKGETKEAAVQIAAGTGAAIAQRIGHTLVLYRARRDGEPTISLPRS
jgi:RNA-binding protein